jgi:hypothetical protein
VGGILYINDNHYIRLKERLGGGSNNFADLFALKLLLAIVVENDVSHIQILGDTMVIIK